MLPDKLSFVDIETTGTGFNFDRIIEIAILRVEHGQLVDQFSTLVNPETFVSPYVETLTGIGPADLESAPTFYHIKDQILSMLDDSVFVAHNARFDYGFIRHELSRFGHKYTSRHLCTVKLFRALCPDVRHHNLDSLIDHFHLTCPRRHRAYDDAAVLWQFIQKVTSLFPPEVLTEHINLGLRRPSLPAAITPDQVDNLPESPGVYLFYASDGTVLYVGKSVNLKDRILSHFSSDQSNSTDLKITRQISSFEIIPTAGELSALLLESRLIKEKLPLYNRRLRLKHELLLLKKDQIGPYLTTRLESAPSITPADIHGLLLLFKSRRQHAATLSALAKQYFLCPKLLGLEQTEGACFNYHLGYCKGACLGREDSLRYNLRFLEAFGRPLISAWPFSGPVIISESDSLTGKRQTLEVNNWCLVDQDHLDLDTYRILHQFINNPKNQSKIHPLRLSQSKQ